MDILTYKEYWNQISSIALESLDLLGEDEDFDQDRWLHETVEYHEYIIYYYRAKQVLMYTDNEDAVLDMMGSSEMTADSVGQQICNIAYWAMYQDVMDRLAHIDEVGRDIWEARMPKEADAHA